MKTNLYKLYLSKMKDKKNLTRRLFLKTSAVAGAASVVGTGVVGFLSSRCASSKISSSTTVKTGWPKSSYEMKPWTRWWWPGNAVDQRNIERELKEMAEAGIGGVEITSMTGIGGEEHRFIEYLSAEYLKLQKFTINKAHELGLGVDLPPGAGWSCGGPFVPEEKGLLNLQIHSSKIEVGEIRQLPGKLNNVIACSYLSEDGDVTILQAGGKFKALRKGTVYTAEYVYTGRTVDIPSPGGDGLVINTYDAEITNWYLKEFWKRVDIPERLVRCFFHDSFEYNSNFTLRFMEEFKGRRGYDLAKYLYVLAGDCPDEEVVVRVRSDYRETISELVLESFIQPMKEWANSHKSLLRNQATGSPGNILDIYAASDIPETEIYGLPRDNKAFQPGTVAIFTNKFASSAAHVSGKKLVSSESFTWLNEHWNESTSDMLRATNRFFMAGVNHIIFHGTCYSPENAIWPGWVFYATTQMNSRNPLWRELKALFKYIERSQSILQNAIPQNDVLVYWPFYDVSVKEYGINHYTNIDHGDAGPWFKGFPIASLSEKLMNAGYTFDYISDKQLLDSKTSGNNIVTSGGAVYKTIVVPKTKYIPVETMQQLHKFLTDGIKVYFDESLPESVPGMFNLSARERKLKEIKDSISAENWIGDVIELLEKSDVKREKSLSEKGFHFITMKMDNVNWYMVFNAGTESIDEWVELNYPAKSYIFLNAMDGDISKAENKGNSVHIQLEPEQVLFIKCSAENEHVPQFTYVNPQAETDEITGNWNIHFTEGGPVYPNDIITDKLGSWTSLGGDETKRFAGTAQYTLEFDWTKKVNSAELNLGIVKDCARVKLNGKEFEVLLGPTFKVKVDNLKEGKNILNVEVTNVGANRIRDLDIRKVDWKQGHIFETTKNRILFYNNLINPSEWQIREAGLMGPVTIKTF